MLLAQPINERLLVDRQFLSRLPAELRQGVQAGRQLLEISTQHGLIAGRKMVRNTPKSGALRPRTQVVAEAPQFQDTRVIRLGTSGKGVLPLLKERRNVGNDVGSLIWPLSSA